MTPKRPRHRQFDNALPFDTTQEIDPKLVEDLRTGVEPTLTQTDFDDVTVVLPEGRKPLP